MKSTFSNVLDAPCNLWGFGDHTRGTYGSRLPDPAELKCCLGQRMVLLRPNQDAADSRYLVYCIQGPVVQRAIAAGGGAGSTVSNLRIPVLKSLLIPIPTRPEQHAIAAALSEVDALLAKLDQLIAKTRPQTGRHAATPYRPTACQGLAANGKGRGWAIYLPMSSQPNTSSALANIAIQMMSRC